jgi:DNA-binding response OmpR family regulator
MKPIMGEGSPTSQAPVAPRMSVLVMDEDANDLRFFLSLLEQEGYEVRACSTYADALRRLESAVSDFIIVSQGSPKFEGRSLLKRANDIDRRLLVLVLERCADVGCYLKAIQSSALDYLQKRGPPEELVCFVQSHLRAPP